MCVVSIIVICLGVVVVKRRQHVSDEILISSKPKKLKKPELPSDELEAALLELDSKVLSNSDREFVNEYELLYKRLKVLVRKSYSTANRSGQSRDYYALCTLISQQREVIADIRAVSDLSGQVQLIIDNALQPMVSAIGQAMIDSFYQQRKLITETSKDKETQFALRRLEEITSALSTSLQAHYAKAADDINNILLGVPEEPKKAKKKRRIT